MRARLLRPPPASSYFALLHARTPRGEVDAALAASPEFGEPSGRGGGGAPWSAEEAAVFEAALAHLPEGDPGRWDKVWRARKGARVLSVSKARRARRGPVLPSPAHPVGPPPSRQIASMLPGRSAEEVAAQFGRLVADLVAIELGEVVTER